MAFDAVLLWFRRDLRLDDQAALYQALRQGRRVYCVFVFDREILDALPPGPERRVAFIHGAVTALQAGLAAAGGGLLVLHDRASTAIPRLATALGVDAVFVNRDYEPAAKARDAAVAATLAAAGIAFQAFKDQAIFDKDEVLTRDGRPFSVFTPYQRAWMQRLQRDGSDFYYRAYPVSRYLSRLAPPPEMLAGASSRGVPALAELGFSEPEGMWAGLRGGSAAAEMLWEDFQPRLAEYAARRDFPAHKGVSYLSVHLRFGTISPRRLVAAALQAGNAGASCWLGELVWRDFYFMILDHFPHGVSGSFKPAYDRIVWDDWPEGFAAWCAGQTGYPLVDAAQRQLLQSGYMHNRLRMVSASFLCKDLGIAWQLGERWFAAQLNDFDLAANNGGWQWAASSGCDAQPYFRIFNPVTQSEKFDAEGKFIRRYVPELAAVPLRHLHAPWKMSASEQAACGVVLGRDYPWPLVDHAAAREKTLARYAVVKTAA